MKAPSLLFILRKVNAHGVGTVAAQIFVHGKRKIRSLPIHIHQQCWDGERRRVRHAKGHISATEASSYNMMMVQQRDAFTRIVTSMELRGEPLAMERIISQMDNAHHGHCFHTWASQRIADLEGIHSKNTIRHYRCTFDAFREFMPTCSYADLTPLLVDRWEHWIIRTKGICVNSRSKYHKHIKTFARELARHVPGIPDIYAHFPIRQTKGRREFLNRNEVERLRQIYEEGNISPHLMPCLAMFLFSCHTGLRFSDLMAINWHNLKENYLVFTPKKTERIDKVIDVPIGPQALRYCHNHTGRMFNRISNMQYNRNLKEIARAAGIVKNMSAHVSRHTFATAYLANGGNVYVLQRIMGHAKIETTMIYVHISREMIEEERSIMETMY
jgi:integrase/recombinase XerD